MAFILLINVKMPTIGVIFMYMPIAKGLRHTKIITENVGIIFTVFSRINTSESFKAKRQNLYFLPFYISWAIEISCSVELSMKKFYIMARVLLTKLIMCF